jgi:hypothetical protein
MATARRLHPLKLAPPSPTFVPSVTEIAGMPSTHGRIILIGGAASRFQSDPIVLEGGLPMMNALPALIVTWAVFTGLFLALLAYNATLTRYEENQLFLDDINAGEKEQQTTIVRKIHRMTPYIRTLGSLSAVMTVVIIAIVTWDAWQKIQQ